MRRKAKVDDNQQEIVRLLRQLGCSVKSLAAVGGGCPDLLVGTQGKNLLIEVKDGAKAKSRRKLTTDQQEFHKTWDGRIHLVETDQDVLDLLVEERKLLQSQH